MPDNQAIIQVLYQTQGVDSLKAANAELDKSQKAATGVGRETQKAGEFAGFTRREFTRTGAEASYALTMIGGKASAAHQELVPLIQGASEMGRAFLFGGSIASVAIVGAAVAFGAISTAIDPATQQTKDFWKTVDDVAAADSATRGLQQITGATQAQTDAVIIAIKANKDYARSWKDVQDAGGKNFLQQAGDNLGEYIKKLWVANAYETEYLRALKSGATEQEAENRALEAGIIALTGYTSAQLAKQKALVDQAPILNEHNRLLDLMKTNLPNIVKENESFAASMDKLTVAHKKAVASFNTDVLAADAKANADRITAQVNTANSIEKIYASLSTRLGDMAEDAADRQAQSEHDWLRQAAGFADQRAQIERNLADEISSITRSEAEQEGTAKTYAEVLRLRRDRDARLQDATNKAGENRTQLQKNQDDALSEHNYKENLSERESIKTAQRARRDADTQSQEAQRAERVQEEAIATRLRAEKSAIQTRVNEESAAYKQSQADATRAHSQRMKELQEYKTELQSTMDNLIALSKTGISIPIQFQLDLLKQSGASGALTDVLAGGAGYFSGRSHEQGGSGIFPGSGSSERPYVISAQPGERYEITPKDKSTGGVNFYNCVFRDVSDVYAALNQRDRGLA